MFHFPRCPSQGYGFTVGSLPLRPRVAPFGNPRIKACLRLPEAYRVLTPSFFGS